MSALGYPDCNVVGISHGSRLALEVLRTAPGGVRPVIVDGVAPPDERLHDDLFAPHEDATEALFAQCAGDAASADAYPDLRKSFVAPGDVLAGEGIPAARGRPAITADGFHEVVNVRMSDSEAWTRKLSA
jgi:pimeloyl-ACP methyl ester carboxylesterase